MSRSHSRHCNLRTWAVKSHLEMLTHINTLNLSFVFAITRFYTAESCYKGSSCHYVYFLWAESVSLPFRRAEGVAFCHGWLWLCGRRNSGDATVVCTQHQAETQAQHQRQQQVVLPVWYLADRALIVLVAAQQQCLTKLESEKYSEDSEVSLEKKNQDEKKQKNLDYKGRLCAWSIVSTSICSWLTVTDRLRTSWVTFSSWPCSKWMDSVWRWSCGSERATRSATTHTQVHITEMVWNGLTAEIQEVRTGLHVI